MIGFLKIAESRRLIQCKRIRKCGVCVQTAASALDWKWSGSIIRDVDSHAYGYTPSLHSEKRPNFRKGYSLRCIEERRLLGPFCLKYSTNQFSLSSILNACAIGKCSGLGKHIHGLVVKTGFDLDVYVLNPLIDVYAKCEEMHDAVKLFADLSCKNEVSWNTVIFGYKNLGEGEEALSMFGEALRSQVSVTEVTFISAIGACASLASMELGVQVHGLAIKTSNAEKGAVSNSLIDMYAHCAGIKEAQSVFNEMVTKDVVSWNALISSYSTHGLSREALRIFDIMRDSDCKPNGLTFLVLSGCSIAGLIDQGHDCFESMIHDHGIEPCLEHYTCMVRLLGRSRQLEKAMKLIEGMPYEPSVMIWRAMLSASCVQNNVELARRLAEEILKIDQKDEATYILLSNMYAGAKQWANVASVRKSMKEKDVKKEPGLSWIEHQGDVHYFSVGLSDHPDMKLINGMLEWLNTKETRAGYVPDRNAVLCHMDDEERIRDCGFTAKGRLWHLGLFECHHPETHTDHQESTDMFGLPHCYESDIKYPAPKSSYPRYKPLLSFSCRSLLLR